MHRFEDGTSTNRHKGLHLILIREREMTTVKTRFRQGIQKNMMKDVLINKPGRHQ
jgi:hypothetical protein